jgi:hypothetical protein
MTCPYCAGQIRAEDSACASCGKRLPAHWAQSDVTTVAMAGARSTGKTVYIGVLIKELQRMAVDLRLAPWPQAADESTARVYREIYEGTLFEERRLPAPTATADTQDAYQKEPLVWDFGHVNGRRRYLVIHDVAGEDLTNGVESGLKHFAAADVVLYFIDPLIDDVVSSHLPEAAARIHADSQKSIRALQNLMESLGPRPTKLGVVLSKFDHIHALGSVQDETWSRIVGNLGAALRHDPPPEAGFRLVDGKIVRPDQTDRWLLRAELISLVQFMGLSPFLNIIAGENTKVRPAGLCVFAVSALGEESSGDSVNPRGISPFRCLDPLVWALEDSWTPLAPVIAPVPAPRPPEPPRKRWFWQR